MCRIYEWGQKYNLKIMMEIHGFPGSQSGAQASGCTIIGEEGDHHFYFNTTWNKELALRSEINLAFSLVQNFRAFKYFQRIYYYISHYGLRLPNSFFLCIEPTLI